MNEINTDYRNAYYDFSFKVYRDCRTGEIYKEYYGDFIPEIDTSNSKWQDGCICSIEYDEFSERYIDLETGLTVGGPRHTLVDHMEHYEWAVESAQYTGGNLSDFLDEEYDYMYQEVLCDCGKLDTEDDWEEDEVIKYDGITFCEDCHPDPNFHPDPIRYNPGDHFF
ncbi:hypothetical protein BZG01_21225 [Labilibaculum manganireducens]|uniref:Uncharacterized protein n=1 Tax=Labilibaculum manganireducens TaxID=1940525 RepID=A0A2N3HQ40_9BACT|nr:hypothetical protein [Labilibaculum manganireducens]PKQ60176.1 hypothetical protein BZG01_21225 [Labilibaculum manganireducens]